MTPQLISVQITEQSLKLGSAPAISVTNYEYSDIAKLTTQARLLSIIENTGRPVFWGLIVGIVLRPIVKTATNRHLVRLGFSILAVSQPSRVEVLDDDNLALGI